MSYFQIAHWISYALNTQAQVDAARDVEIMARHEEKAACGLTPAQRVRLMEFKYAYDLAVFPRWLPGD